MPPVCGRLCVRTTTFSCVTPCGDLVGERGRERLCEDAVRRRHLSWPCRRVRGARGFAWLRPKEEVYRALIGSHGMASAPPASAGGADVVESVAAVTRENLSLVRGAFAGGCARGTLDTMMRSTLPFALSLFVVERFERV